MKYHYIPIAIILHILCTTLHCSYETQYASLQLSPTYNNMSYAEIAASIDDFPALSYFASLRPPKADLVKAQAILEGKLSLLKEILSRNIPADIIGVAEVTSSRDAQLKQIHETEHMINRLNDQIKTMSPVQ